MAAIAAAVIGQDPLDDHPVGGEPGLGSDQEPGRGLAGLIGVDLGIGEARVIINRGVDEPMAVQRVAVTAGLAAGAVGLAVAATGGPAQEPMATPSGDVAQLLDIDVDQLAGTLMLIAADRLAADPVQLGQATDAAADQHGMHRGGSQPDLRSDLGRPKSLGPA